MANRNKRRARKASRAQQNQSHPAPRDQQNQSGPAPPNQQPPPAPPNQPPSSADILDNIENAEFDPRFKQIMGYILVYLVFVLYIHFCSFPDSVALMEPPKDLKPAMYSVVNICSLLVSALAYGRPYSPFVIFFCGYFVSVLVAIRYKGSLDWSEKLITIVTIIYLVVKYLWRCIRFEGNRGYWSEN